MKRLILEIKNNYNDDVALCSFDEEIVSVSFGALDRGNVSDITNWGCFSNTGDVEFIDKDNRFEQSIADNADAKVCIYCITTTQTNTSKELLATFLVEDYEIDRETKKVSVRLRDALVDFQTQDLEEYYKFGDMVSGGAYIGYPLNTIWVYNYRTFLGAPYSALQLMKKITIDIPYIEKGTRWQHIDKLCQASMMRCFCNKNGVPIISGENVIRQEEYYHHADPVKIRACNILSIENKIPNKKTIVKDVAISAKDYQRIVGGRVSDKHQFTWYSVVGADYNSLGGKTIVANPDLSPSTGRSASNCYAYAEGMEKLPHTFGTVGKAQADTKKWVFEKGELISSTATFSENKYFNVVDYGNCADIDFERVPAIEGRTEGEPSNFVGNFCISGGEMYLIGNRFEESGEQNYGSESQYATRLQSNELIQVNDTIQIGESSSKSLAQHIIDTVKTKYSNGVECVVMEVTPSTYQTKGGATVDRLFEKYEEVIPYVVRNGVEQPYSTNEDGSEKIFKIMGIEYSYRGLLRQKLHLQELV